MEDDTGASARNVVDRIVCADYSGIVINALRGEQRKERGEGGGKGGGQGGKRLRKGEGGAGERKDEEDEDPLEVTYEVGDARSLTYESGSFHLVVEKGTLDAMLSDKTGGMRDCIKIVSNMEQVCKVDRYLVIFYNLNSHVQDGINWIYQLIIAGLRLLDGSGDETRMATKIKVEIHLFYFNLSIM